MKTLFLYYSFTGNGDFIAEKMTEKGADAIKLQTKKSLPRSFLGSMLKGGFLATIGYKMPLVNSDVNLEEYDRVVIGSPVWNGRLACPINTLLTTLDFTGKELAFLLYAGGGEAPKAVKRLAKEYPNAKVVVLKEPKKTGEEPEKIYELF